MFYIVHVVLIAAAVRTFSYYGVATPYSKGILLATGFSFLALICLAHNHAVSLSAEANDGIGISNAIAYMIIGEDRWSVQLFESYMTGSILLTFLLLLAYPCMLTIEKKASRLRQAAGSVAATE
ncbi:hypothetical protein [Paenibacillus sp. NPDC057967]|uniref:hypothetical protein n=1 Tax=Paenibacillus sp. NPDC057967 TaxID=3346293 RepID=UPI0036DC71B8